MHEKQSTFAVFVELANVTGCFVGGVGENLEVCSDFNGPMCRWEIRWAQRMTLEIYSSWRAARLRLKLPCTRAMWSLVVESAKIWIKDEVWKH